MSLGAVIRCDLVRPGVAADGRRSGQLQAAAAARRPIAPRGRLACRAQQPGQEDGGGQGGGGSGTDWDAAWQRYQKARAAGGGAPRTAATRTILPNNSVRIDPTQRQAQDSIRRDESLLVNLWTSQGFQAFLALSLLAVLVAFAGPPPMDDRCTLPWC